MWHNQPLNQKSKSTKKAVGMEVGGDDKWAGGRGR